VVVPSTFFVRRGFAGWLAACSMLAAFPAGADEKTLRVGMDTRSPPWSFVAGLKYSKEDQASDPAISAAQLAMVRGLDVDVARLVAKRLGMKLEIVPTAWASLESGLIAGRYDAIIDAWTRTKQTPPTIAATSPYARWGLLVVVRAENRRIQSWQDLNGMRVGHYRDPAVAQSVRALGGGSLKAYDDPVALFDALKQSDLDAAIFDSPFVDWWMSQNPGFRVVGEPLNRVGYNIGVRKADAELARKLEDVAKSLDGSPEMAAIRKRWAGQQRPALDERQP
jgi:ABC-type amino acid transport substrate-binding protein